MHGVGGGGEPSAVLMLLGEGALSVMGIGRMGWVGVEGKRGCEPRQDTCEGPAERLFISTQCPPQIYLSTSLPPPVKKLPVPQGSQLDLLQLGPQGVLLRLDLSEVNSGGRE